MGEGYRGTCVCPRLLCSMCVCVLMIFLNVLLYFVRLPLPGVFCVPFLFCLNGGRERGRRRGERVFSQCTLEGVARHLLFAMARGRGVGRLVDGGKSLNEKTSHGEQPLVALIYY